jgi:hypothetical protein
MLEFKESRTDPVSAPDRMCGQRDDHPVLITLPETGYLKGFTVEVIATR